MPAAAMLVIADLHACVPEDLKAIRAAMTDEIDGIFCLGDIFSDDVSWLAKSAKNREIPFWYLLGNHDRWLQNNSINYARHLDGASIDLKGIRVAGVSGAPRYGKNRNLAMRSEWEMVRKLQKAGPADILLTHEGPRLPESVPMHVMQNTKSHRGYRAVSWYVAHQKPTIHIFGHYHEPAEFEIGETKELSIYRCAVVRTAPFKVEYII